MDPALLKEFKVFKKSALELPTVEKKGKVKTAAPSAPSKNGWKKKMRPPSMPKLDANTVEKKGKVKTAAPSAPSKNGWRKKMQPPSMPNLDANTVEKKSKVKTAAPSAPSKNGCKKKVRPPSMPKLDANTVEKKSKVKTAAPSAPSKNGCKKKVRPPSMPKLDANTVEKKSKVKTAAPSAPSKNGCKKKMRPPSAPKLDANTYKTTAGTSQSRFGVLTKIVKHMRTRHQDGDDLPLSLEEILDETNQLDIGQSLKTWLADEALINNPKIKVSSDNQRFCFKPVYKLKDGKSLIHLLKQYDDNGLGGILLEDVQESLPHCKKILRSRAKDIIYITRPNDKKKVLFYNDRTADFTIDEEFQKLWHSITVDGMEDSQIEEYLEKQGIRPMKAQEPKKPVLQRKKAPIKKREFKKLRHNKHLADVLKNYEDDTLTTKCVNLPLKIAIIK
ncbi:general transcription factor IIE subunit 2-like isoform X1 [Teleopsis dalmanni]|uniref:general transcription factor IIE subunit 2-like isoform X1 n=1 Tax=Teleopsis dalmanni TaxID=139649 RepID=UPI0018CE701B|nr:general transcription factor IIE subunit 2-like isoform X1 [Teleopsis dalmanni]